MTCKACHFEHPSMMLCGVARRLRETAAAEKEEAHPVAINTVSNAPAINTDAINKTDIAPRSGNRRDRAAYNEYMRGYMKRARAKKNGAKVAAGAAT